MPDAGARESFVRGRNSGPRPCGRSRQHRRSSRRDPLDRPEILAAQLAGICAGSKRDAGSVPVRATGCTRASQRSRRDEKSRLNVSTATAIISKRRYDCVCLGEGSRTATLPPRSSGFTAPSPARVHRGACNRGRAPRPCFRLGGQRVRTLMALRRNGSARSRRPASRAPVRRT
jgi:hypothetical protein